MARAPPFPHSRLRQGRWHEWGALNRAIPSDASFCAANVEPATNTTPCRTANAAEVIIEPEDAAGRQQNIVLTLARGNKAQLRRITTCVGKKAD